MSFLDEMLFGELVTLASDLLEALDVGLDTEHTKDTPERYARMLWELTHPPKFEFTTFPNEPAVDEMVVLNDIPFFSLCQHHVIPFFGVAHVGYIPGSRLAGLSKFARAVQSVSKGLWVQELLNSAIADAIENALVDPLGVAVVLSAEHLCMSMRGVQVPGVRTTTSVLRGAFADHKRLARQEFFNHIDRNGKR